MATKNQLELPTPPTFSQMIEDLEMMSADNKQFKPFPFESSTKENDQSLSNTADETQTRINQFLSGLENLQRFDSSLTTQNDSNNDQLERKLRTIMEQLQMCLDKLQTKTFSSPKSFLSQNK